MQQYTDNVTDNHGNAIKGVAVSVMQNGALVSLYADKAGLAPLANPVVSATNGRFTFFAPAGSYDLVVNGQLQQTIALVDPAATGGGGTSSPSVESRTTPPTSGSYAVRDFVRNSGATPQGPVGAQYLVDGWELLSVGPPLVWLERRISVAPLPGAAVAPTPSPTTAPSPSPAAPYSLKVLAQNATLHNIALVQIVAGYEGTGHADWFRSGFDEYIEFTYAPGSSASGNLTLRYSNYQDQTITVLINGASTGTMITLPSTSGNWGTKVVPGVSLVSGTNKVRLTPVNSGYSYINYAQFDQTTGAPPPPAPAPSPTPAPPAAPAPSAAPGSAPFYPFGSRLDLTANSYLFGIKPAASTATMDAAVKAAYDKWKLDRLAKSPSFTVTNGILAGQTINGGYHVQWGSTDLACVSEGIGYGMLITVCMAGYDANARVYFDGLLSVARGRPAFNMGTRGSASSYLHEWRLLPNMGSGGDGYNAADGDIYIARALLMAHKQWGSAGNWNYYAEALNTIAALKAVNFAANGVMLMPQNVSRTSDYMPGSFRAFKAATNDSFWDDARSNSLALLQTVITNFSPSAKLPCGFIYDPLGTNPRPDTIARVDRSGIEDIYDANAVRVPWWLAEDYVKSGDATCKSIAKNIVTTLQTSSGGSASAFSYAYGLDGTARSGLYHEATTAGCAMAGCMVDPTLQTFLNTLFTGNTGTGFDSRYYSAELQLLPLILASGNWFWTY